MLVCYASGITEYGKRTSGLSDAAPHMKYEK